MVCLSVILLCYRMTCLWFANKRFCKKKALFLPNAVFLSSKKEFDVNISEVLCASHLKCSIFQPRYAILYSMNTNGTNMFFFFFLIYLLIMLLQLSHSPPHSNMFLCRWHTYIFKRRIIKQGYFLKTRIHSTSSSRIVGYHNEKLKRYLLSQESQYPCEFT